LKKSLAEIDLVYEINSWNQQFTVGLGTTNCVRTHHRHNKLEPRLAEPEPWWSKTLDEILTTPAGDAFVWLRLAT
jgi:hypothetical protein